MENILSLEWQAVWKILVTGIILGAGLPALFAVGVRSMAYGQGGDAEISESGVTAPAPNSVGTVLGYVCFAIVLLAVVLGLIYIISTGFGKVLSFDHIYPTIHAKS
jgi:hypothetical protein